MPRREIRTQIGIEAAPEEVWRVLADFGAFPEWNPLIREISGEAKPGARLRVTIQPPGASPMAFQPTVTACEPLRELRWLGRVLIPGLLDGEHSFAIQALGPRRVRFLHAETFSGLLVPFFGGMLEKTRQGFEEMNRALKARVEKARRAETCSEPG